MSTRDAKNLSSQRVLIFGGTGSLGRALLDRLAGRNAIMLFSRDEAKHWTIRNQVGSDNIFYAVGDIRDPSRVEEVLLRFQPSIVIVAAALKQVDTCELTPHESVQTNVLGIKNVVDSVSRQADRLSGLETVLMVSTDKACAPTNVYGMCKAIAERLVTSQCQNFARPRFVGVRYGNVLDSRGSIIPLFRWQAENSPTFTVTHPSMTRFVMTLDESIDLIIDTAEGAKSGEIWLPRLRSMRILDLAQIFSERFRKPVEIVGMRPGEKLHEALISEPESVRIASDSVYYRMAPAHSPVAIDARIFKYESNDEVLTRDELHHYLTSIGILEKRLDQFVGRQIEEIASPSVTRVYK
ncbi:MAG: polysaccharide biosynthesis protein [Hyphomicrobiaceae bacterium]